MCARRKTKTGSRRSNSTEPNEVGSSQQEIEQICSIWGIPECTRSLSCHEGTPQMMSRCRLCRHWMPHSRGRWGFDQFLFFKVFLSVWGCWLHLASITELSDIWRIVTPSKSTSPPVFIWRSHNYITQVLIMFKVLIPRFWCEVLEPNWSQFWFYSLFLISAQVWKVIKAKRIILNLSDLFGWYHHAN